MNKSTALLFDDTPRGLSTDPILESDSSAMPQYEAERILYVLVVSAYGVHRERLTALLAGGGYRVIEAASVADALENVRSRHFDLIVTGIRMFPMDGLELLRIVHETVPNLPVIAIGDAAAEMNTVYLRCADLLGAFQTHSFPPDPGTFLDGVEQAIRQHRVEL